MNKPKDFSIEALQEDEIETSEDEVYLPDSEFKNLEVEEYVYTLLEYISLDWPSQSIDLLAENTIILATNPSEDDPSLLKIDFNSTNNFSEMKNFTFEKIRTTESFNRVRVGKNKIFCIADNNFTVFNKNFTVNKEFKDNFGYGIAEVNEKVCVSLSNGNIKLIDFNRNKFEERKLHDSSIECLDFYNNLLFSASTDKSIKITDLRAKQPVFTKKYDCDINSISFNQVGHVIFGDDNGVLRLMDINIFEEEEIFWHKSPISMVKFKNEDEFISASNEQVAFWNKDFVDDWEFHKYICFVHQGQSYYKDFAWNMQSEVFFSTSADGLCVFSPLTE